MDDLNEKISKLISSEEGMKMISEVAAGLMKDGGGEGGTPDITALLPLLSGGETDKAAGLLNALKPFLSEKRCKRMDTAIQMIKLGEIASAFVGGEKKGDAV